jgi:hypothetical protein
MAWFKLGPLYEASIACLFLYGDYLLVLCVGFTWKCDERKAKQSTGKARSPEQPVVLAVMVGCGLRAAD